MLATLAVPIEPVPSETNRFLEVDDNSRDKAKRLANLLRMDVPPTRATLMKEVVSRSMSVHLVGLEVKSDSGEVLAQY